MQIPLYSTFTNKLTQVCKHKNNTLPDDDDGDEQELAFEVVPS